MVGGKGDTNDEYKVKDDRENCQPSGQGLVVAVELGSVVVVAAAVVVVAMVLVVVVVIAVPFVVFMDLLAIWETSLLAPFKITRIRSILKKISEVSMINNH